MMKQLKTIFNVDTTKAIISAILLVTSVNVAYAIEVIQCKVTDNSYFELQGRRTIYEGDDIEPHEIYSSGMIRDSYAYDYSIYYHAESGKVTRLSFATGASNCKSFGLQNNTIYALITNASYPFKTKCGKLGGHALVISRDNGETFSKDIHPASQSGNNCTLSDAKKTIDAYTVYDSMIRIDANQILIEMIGDPLMADFLSTSTPLEKIEWTKPEFSVNPQIYSMTATNHARDTAAISKWVNLVYAAGRKACEITRSGHNCERKTHLYWDAIWDECRQQGKVSPQECISKIPLPTPVTQ